MLFPIACIGCGSLSSVRTFLCDRCAETLPALASAQCPVCKARIPSGKVCSPCRAKARLSYFVAATSLDYPLAQRAVWTLKYNFVASLAAPLGRLLAQALTATIPQEKIRGSTVVPMPLSRRRQNWRGFNQADAISRVVADTLDIAIAPTREAWLQRIKERKEQAKLNFEERLENINGAFVVPRAAPVSGTRIILIDDVLTSGATMFEAARTLREAGVKEVLGAVVARG